MYFQQEAPEHGPVLDSPLPRMSTQLAVAPRVSPPPPHALTVQLVDPTIAYQPAAQLVGDAAELSTCVPASAAVHCAAPAAEYELAAHARHAAPAPGLYWPAGHASQVVRFAGERAVVPAGHAMGPSWGVGHWQ